MNTYEVTKNYTPAKVKTDVKTSVMEGIMNYLRETYGENAVSMIRTGNSTKVNEIGVEVGVASMNGEEFPICVTLNPSVKEFYPHATAKKKYEAFDMNAAAEAYVEYMEEKSAKDSEKAAAKAEKIKADEEFRAKRKEMKMSKVDTNEIPF